MLPISQDCVNTRRDTTAEAWAAHFIAVIMGGGPGDADTDTALSSSTTHGDTRSRARGRTAQEDLDVMVRGGHVRLDHLLGHEAHAAGPAGRGVVEHVVDAEAVRVLGRELVELLLEQDVLRVDVRVDERELRAVERVLERGAHDLEHGRDARPARDHAELARERRVVLELALRALDAHLVADLE